LQESGTYWFNPSSLESDSEFMLLGLVAGLAIYNGAQHSRPPIDPLCSVKQHLWNCQGTEPDFRLLHIPAGAKTVV
jgi:hypothetical protein